jgi:hypothetical protein
MRRFIFSLLICSVFALQGIAAAQESGNGAIDGQVINDTAGGGNVAGLQVCLIAYAGNEMQSTDTTTTDEEGKFRFEGLSRENTYLVSVTYMGVDYYYPVVFSSDEGAEFIQVAVCDSTESDEYIKVALAHKIIDFENENAIVTEMFVLVNGGDRTYVGDEESVVGNERGTLMFTLPQGATGFQSAPELAEDFLLLEDGRVAYTVPFPPGELQLFFFYSLPMPRRDELALSFTADYPTDYLDIMVKSDNIEVTTGQLAPADPVETGTGDRYIHYTGRNISRDSSIEIRLARLSDNSSFIFILAVSILVIIVIAVVVFLVKRKSSIGGKQVNNNAGEDI